MEYGKIKFEGNENDLVNHIKNEVVLAQFVDDKGDTKSVVKCSDSLTVIRVTDSDVSSDDYYRILPDDALTLLNLAGLNTTANDLRVKLAEKDALFKRAQELIIKHEELADEQNKQLAEANRTIEALRGPDADKRAEAWDAGFAACEDALGLDSTKATKNPYR